jgi:hypothetical protein
MGSPDSKPCCYADEVRSSQVDFMDANSVTVSSSRSAEESVVAKVVQLQLAPHERSSLAALRMKPEQGLVCQVSPLQQHAQRHAEALDDKQAPRIAKSDTDEGQKPAAPSSKSSSPPPWQLKKIQDSHVKSMFANAMSNTDDFQRDVRGRWENNQMARKDAPREFKIRLQRTAEATTLGVNVDVSAGRYLIIDSVDGTGMIGAWNAAHPEEEIKAGDKIVDVNGLSGNAGQLALVCANNEVLDILILRNFRYGTSTMVSC